MHVIVIGAGIIGNLSAWYLAQRGIKVTIIERNDDVAQEASAANASQLAYDSIYTMASPEFLGLLPSVLLGRNPVVKIRNYMDWRMWLWGAAFLRQCLPSPVRRNEDTLIYMAAQSKILLKILREKAAGDFGYSENGRLRLYSDVKVLNSDFQDLHKREPKGATHHKMLGPEECVAANPLLAQRQGSPLAGGIFCPGDFAGDTAQFCAQIKKTLSGKSYDVTYRTGILIDEIEMAAGGKGHIECLKTHSGEEIRGDAYLFCAGAFTRPLLAQAGVRMNMYPVKGSTIVVPRQNIADELQHNITDMAHRLVFAPLPERVRISSGMYFDGLSRHQDQYLANYIRETALRIVPDLDFSKAVVHTGLRPATPSGLPIVKRYGRTNIYMNTGHGMWGWTLAPVTCHEIAELIAISA